MSRLVLSMLFCVPCLTGLSATPADTHPNTASIMGYQDLDEVVFGVPPPRSNAALLLPASPSHDSCFQEDILAHSGRTNSCGCHFNRKTGSCHCHRDLGCGCDCEPKRCSDRKTKP